MAKSAFKHRLLVLFLTVIAVANPIIILGAVSKDEISLGWGIWTVVILPTVLWALYIKYQMKERPIKKWETRVLMVGLAVLVSSFLFIEERLRSIMFFALLIDWVTFMLRARKYGRHNVDSIMFYGIIAMIATSFTTVIFEFTTGYNLIVLKLWPNSIYFYTFIAILGVNVFRNYLDVVSLNTLLHNRTAEGEKAMRENQWFAATFGLVSHNMKTPLANALGQLEIVRLRTRNMEGADQLTDGFNQIEQSIYSTKETLEETIQLYKEQISHTERGTLTLSDLEQAVHRFEEDIPVTFTNGSRKKSIPASTYFVLHRFLETAVDNALKYSGSVPKIILTNSKILVQDYGPGFSEAEINALGREIVKSRKGSGLGLYFTNSLLGTINWKLTVKNTPSGGCIVATPLPN